MALPLAHCKPQSQACLTTLHPGRHRRRADYGSKHKRPEAELQEKIIRHLVNMKIPHYGTPNGAAEANKNYGLAAALKKRGAHAGVPDILVFRAGRGGAHGLAMELKIGTNQLSVKQLAWKADLEREGWRCAR